MALEMHSSLTMPAGQWLKEAYILPEKLKVSFLAERLGITRQALTAVLNGRSALTPSLAVKLEEALGVSANTLMTMQTAYDLAQARGLVQVKNIMEEKMNIYQYVHMPHNFHQGKITFIVVRKGDIWLALDKNLYQSGGRECFSEQGFEPFDAGHTLVSEHGVSADTASEAVEKAKEYVNQVVDKLKMENVPLEKLIQEFESGS